ncbi:MAG: AMP-binding protein [Candidatus Hermodarchaeota archaeon]
MVEKFWLKSYDSHVKPNLSYTSDDLGTILTNKMKEFPDKIGIYFMDAAFPYKEVLEYSQKFATFLQKNGIEKGDVVSICLPNTPQYLFAVYGTYMAGATVSGCSPLMSGPEIQYQLEDSNAKAIVTMDIIYEKRLTPLLEKLPNLKLIIPTNISEFMGFGGFKVFMGKLIGKIPKGKMNPYPGRTVVPFLEALKTKIDIKRVSINNNEDAALIQYTGGTTGRPKGTIITHANLVANLTQFDAWLGREHGKEVLISAFPFFHIAGYLIGLFLPFISGTQTLIANPRDTDHIINELIDKKPSSFGNVPTLFLMIMNNPKAKDIPDEVLDNISVYVSGAAPFPEEAIREFEKFFHAQNKFVEVYGMTESSPLATANPAIGTKKIGSVGLPLPDTEIKIIDVDTGKELGVGEPGEILIRGPQVTKGYHNKPEESKEAFDNEGFFHSGDVGVFDEEGYLKIVDRTKDMLIVSGFKVYSVHVEEVMTKHPDIEILAIIGVPNPDRPGAEIVKAVVQLKEGVVESEEVKASIQEFAEENLSKYEVPKIWEFRQELPLTLVGKVQKKALREE